jgi:hypothetical protein
VGVYKVYTYTTNTCAEMCAGVRESICSDYAMASRQVLRKRKRCDEKPSGHDVLVAVHNTLDAMPFTRHKHQRLFHEEFLKSITPFVFGASYEMEYPSILRNNSWVSLQPNVMIITPRRWGKTTCVAMFVAAVALCVPESKQCIFSTSRRTSQLLLGMVLGLVQRFKPVITRSNQESLFVAGDDFDVRTIYSFPSNEKIDTGPLVPYLRLAPFSSVPGTYKVGPMSWCGPCCKASGVRFPRKALCINDSHSESVL